MSIKNIENLSDNEIIELLDKNYDTLEIKNLLHNLSNDRIVNLLKHENSDERTTLILTENIIDKPNLSIDVLESIINLQCNYSAKEIIAQHLNYNICKNEEENQRMYDLIFKLADDAINPSTYPNSDIKAYPGDVLVNLAQNENIASIELHKKIAIEGCSLSKDVIHRQAGRKILNAILDDLDKTNFFKITGINIDEARTWYPLGGFNHLQKIFKDLEEAGITIHEIIKDKKTLLEQINDNIYDIKYASDELKRDKDVVLAFIDKWEDIDIKTDVSYFSADDILAWSKQDFFDKVSLEFILCQTVDIEIEEKIKLTDIIIDKFKEYEKSDWYNLDLISKRPGEIFKIMEQFYDTDTYYGDIEKDGYNFGEKKKEFQKNIEINE